MTHINFSDYETAFEINSAFDRQLRMDRLLVVLLGPSAVGKTSIIRRLIEMSDTPFSYVKAVTTRPNRPGETDKISVDDETFDATIAADGFVSVNNLYGVRYGTPLSEIVTPLQQGIVPITDFPLTRIGLLRRPEFDTLNFYIFPDTVEGWIQRSHASGRSNDGRLDAGLDELNALEAANYEHPDIDVRLVNAESSIDATAHSINQTIKTVLKIN